MQSNTDDNENNDFLFLRTGRQETQESRDPYLLLHENPLNGWCRLSFHIDVKLYIASSLDCSLLEVSAVDARLDC